MMLKPVKKWKKMLNNSEKMNLNFKNEIEVHFLIVNVFSNREPVL